MSAMASDSAKTGIVWYKYSDLRTIDHEPLVQAHRDNERVLHAFCIDPRWFGTTKRGTRRMSEARCRFMLESISNLQSILRSSGSDLFVLQSKPEDTLPALASKSGAHTIYCHTDVCSEEADVHAAVQSALNRQTRANEGGQNNGVLLKNVWGNTMHLVSDLPFNFPQGVPEVFTQFRKTVERNCQIQPPLPRPAAFRPSPQLDDPSLTTEVPTTEDLGLGPAPSRDAKAVLPFEGGESAGLERVKQYIWDEDRLRSYKETRNGLLGAGFSSKFSPWLALGCLSPKSIVQEIRKYEKERVENQSTYWLIFELLWRDYFRYSAVKNGNSIFHLGGPRHDAGRQRWSDDRGSLEAWKEGETGYPFVDANMRELKSSGFMSNRGRQVVASFFTKDMGMDWRLGAEHFEEYLLDHDPASNWGNWNYVAGVGSDPREDRYFNIEKQAKNYDSDADYIRHWLPELVALPTGALQTPGGITTMLRHVHDIPSTVYPDPVCRLKFAGPGKGGGSRGGGGGGKRGGQSSSRSAGGRKSFKSSRIQHGM